MLAKTHLYMAEVTLDHAKSRGVYLNEKLFRLGSIIPDFSPYHKYVRHYRKDSYEYVERLIYSLIGSKNINDISFKSGIASHYLADYFCYPHYNNMTLLGKGAIEHVRYETELDKFVNKNLVENTSKILEYSFKSINEIVDAQTSIYLNEKSFIEDMAIAQNTITNFIINAPSWEKKIIFV